MCEVEQFQLTCQLCNRGNILLYHTLVNVYNGSYTTTSIAKEQYYPALAIKVPLILALKITLQVLGKNPLFKAVGKGKWGRGAEAILDPVFT